jgi:hypothetical protein
MADRAESPSLRGAQVKPEPNSVAPRGDKPATGRDLKRRLIAGEIVFVVLVLILVSAAD